MAITDPTDIVGLRAWYKVESSYSDAGSTLAGDGDSVQQVNDGSGNDYHATQATPGDRPVKVEDITVGSAEHGLHFDNANSFLAMPSDLHNPAITAGALFLRLVIMDSAFDSIIISGNKAGSNAGDWQLYIGDYGDIQFKYNNMSVTLSTSGDAVPYGVWTTIVLRWDSGGAEIWIDGSLEASNANGASIGPSGDSQLYLGEQSIGGDNCHMIVGEWGIYDSAVSDADRQDLESYLAARFISPGWTYDGTSDANVGASQGVATDGTYWWTTGTTDATATLHRYIYKYTKSGNTYTLTDTIDTYGDWPAGMAQINALRYSSGYLYVGGNNYDTTPELGWILIYNATTGAFVGSFSTLDAWCEGGAFGPNGNFFASFANVYTITEIEATTWSNTATWSEHAAHTPSTTYPSGSNKYNGNVWIGDFYLANWHEGMLHPFCDVFKWTGDSMYRIYRLSPPTQQCTQGIHRDPTDMTKLYWAERDHGGGGITKDYRIVESTLDDNWPDLGTFNDQPHGQVYTYGVLFE